MPSACTAGIQKISVNLNDVSGNCPCDDDGSFSVTMISALWMLSGNPGSDYPEIGPERKKPTCRYLHFLQKCSRETSLPDHQRKKFLWIVIPSDRLFAGFS